jgi:hypothetical protein
MVDLRLLLAKLNVSNPVPRRPWAVGTARLSTSVVTVQSKTQGPKDEGTDPER